MMILYQNDRAMRARALSASIGAPMQDVQTPPKAVPGLKTIILWGHCNVMYLCDKTPDQMKTLVKEWKALNPKLTTVEIITCNAAHGGAGLLPYAEAFKNLLHHGFMSSGRDIVVKAPPVSMTQGAGGGWSILYADHPSRTWLYATSRHAENYVVGILKLFITRLQEKHQYDLIQCAEYIMKNDFTFDGYKNEYKVGKFTINYGNFKSLRSILRVV